MFHEVREGLEELANVFIIHISKSEHWSTWNVE